MFEQAERIFQSPPRYRNFIAGDFTDAEGGEFLSRESPAHGRIVSHYPASTRADAEAAIAAARASFEAGNWAFAYGGDRAKVLREVAQSLRRNVDHLALIETLETSKPLDASRGEVMFAAELWDYAAGLARILHGDSHNTLGEDMLGLVLREPIGVIGIITPWNFPLLILSERLPFALAAGCSVVVKPSEFTSGTALMLGQYLRQAGLPDGVCNIVAGTGDQVGQAILDSAEVDMVAFTGSTRVGRAAIAASAGNIKKLSLELGGKSPSIVFADCDQDAAIDGVIKAATTNMGECCIAGSRLLVEASVAEAFQGRLAERLQELRMGDPLDPMSRIGAIINRAQFDKISESVREGVRDGARIVCGGDPENHPGLFYPPTVLADVKPAMSVAQQEIFGPVLVVMPFNTLEEAIGLANDSDYGLAAYVWTNDLSKALTCSRRIRAGRIWVNSALQGYPELPLGGFKQSGNGRETGRYGVEEYTEVKSVHLHIGPQAERWVAGS